MRKHFLLLFLMALLPLAGWADAISLATAEVTLNRTQLDYTGTATGPVITALTIGGVDKLTDLVPTKIAIKYYKKTGATTYSAIDADEVRNAGNYALTLIKGTGDTYTGESAKFDFTINQGELHITFATAGTEKVYGGADPVALEYTWDNPSELKGDDDVNNVILTFTGLDQFTTAGVAGSPYTFTDVDVTTPNYRVYTSGTPKLIVTPAPLTVVYDLNNNIVKTFGDPNPALASGKIKITGWVGAENVSTDTPEQKAAARALAVTGTLGYSQPNTHANYNAAGTATIGEYALYTCTFSGYESTNYSIVYPTNKMMIKQRAFAAAPSTTPGVGNPGFTYTNKDAEKTFTYTGAVQTPDVEITYTNEEGTVFTAGEGDFVVAYAGGESTDPTKDDMKTARAYTATLNVPTTNVGNFSGSLDVDAFDYTIEQKKLWVYFKNVEKVYKNADYKLAPTGTSPSVVPADFTAEFEFNGLVSTDTPADMSVGITASYKDGHSWTEINTATSQPYNDHKNVGSYYVTPVIAADAAVKVNYDVVALSTGKITVAQRPINITADPVTRTFDGTVPTTFTATAEATGTDRGLASGETIADLAGTFTVGLKVTDPVTDYAQPDTYTNAIVVTLTEAAKTSNYKITGVPGTLQVNGAGLTVIAENKTITYGATVPVFTKLTDYIGDESDLGKATFILKKGAQTIEYDATTILDQGTYDIVIAETLTKPTGYTGISYVPGTLTVNKRTVYVRCGDITVNQNATVNELNTLGKNKIIFTQTNDAEDKTSYLVSDDKIGFKLAFVADATGTTSVSNTITLDGDKNLDPANTPADSYTNGYALAALTDAEIEAAEADDIFYANDNYTFVPASFADAKGKLIVKDAKTLILAAKDPQLYDKIKFAATDCAAIKAAAEAAHTDPVYYDVTFADRPNLAEKQWDTFVLPFDIKVSQLSREFGYAIVNLYNAETSDAQHVRFSLVMDNIPANTPFLVKTADGTNWASVTIHNVEIKAPATATFSKEYKEDNVLVTTETGLYETKTIYGSDWYFFQDTWSKGNASGTNLFATFAYWSPADPQARVFVEDLDDNGTTVIKELNMETMSTTLANGWYTLNGIKLQGAPTEKGVYINNGKKVVIK